MERYRILAPAVEWIFFFFCRKNICLSALQRNSHQDTQRRGTQRKVAEEEESKLTECSIKNTRLRYMSQEHLGETIGIFFFFHFKTGQQVQHHRKHQAKKKRLQVCLWAIRFQSDNKRYSCSLPAGFKRHSETSRALHVRKSLTCSLSCFTAALTLWLVYLSTMMAEG